MSAPADTRPPSPPRSPAVEDKVLPSTEIPDVAQLQTPPGPTMAAHIDDYPYDMYGDPTMYHTSTPQQYYQSQDAYTRYHQPYQTPPPATYTEVGIQTRSGRSLTSPQSPRTRAQSPKKKQPKKRAAAGKTSTPILSEPLSVLTKDYDIPLQDMDAKVNRPSEQRIQEVQDKCGGKIPRPMNSFMLYRSAYADRIKHFCKENNHQVVSVVSGASWRLEPEAITKEYERLAVLDRDNHALAFPNYKFAPNKDGKKRARDDDDEHDGEWGGSQRTKRSRTAMSSRYDDSRSNTGTPFDECYYAPVYSPAPSHHIPYNPSSYQHQYPGRVAPVYHQGGYPDFMQPRVSQYAPGVEDVHYDRYQPPMMHHHEPPAVVGMPTVDNHGVLVPDPENIGIGMVDPRLGGGSYELQPGYGPPPVEAYHPGQATLTDGWCSGVHPGAAFDQEFDQMAYQP